MFEQIISAFVFIISVPLITAICIDMIWMDEKFTEPPDNINSDIEDDE